MPVVAFPKSDRPWACGLATLSLAVLGACAGGGGVAGDSPTYLTLSPANPKVTAGRSLQFQAGGTGLDPQHVVWAVADGAGGTVSATGLYRAPAVPGLYSVHVQSGTSVSRTAHTQVEVVPPPVASRLHAPVTALHAGEATHLIPEFNGGSGVIHPGVGPVTSGVPCTVTPLVSTTYLLTVTNAARDSVSIPLTLEVVGSVNPARIHAPRVVARGSRHIALVEHPTPHRRYHWRILGGHFQGGAQETEGLRVAYVADQPGILVLTCTPSEPRHPDDGIARMSTVQATPTPLVFEVTVIR